jgi:hypothetical protein
MYELQEPLTKEYILNHLTQEQIMEHYLGVPITFNRKICSPLRRDNNPTCGFRYAPSGDLYFRDFSGHFAGNAFNVVEYIYGCNFNEALEIIAKDFKLRDGESRVERVEYNYDMIRESQKRNTEIHIRIRPFNSLDKDYWSSFGISKATLQHFGVYACEAVWLNGKMVYRYTKDDPAYAYRFDEGVYKIYYPTRNKMRFMCNTNVMQGQQQLNDTGNFVVLTKSMKDVMCLYEFGIPAVAPQSESAYPDEDIIDMLKDKFKKVYTFYDFDYAGIKMASEISRRYNIEPIFLTNGRFGTIDYGAKDWSDFVRKHGKDYAIMLVESFKKASK